MAEKVNYKKLLEEKFPPQNAREQVLASLIIHLDERATKLELAFTKVVTDLRSMLVAEEAAEAVAEPEVPKSDDKTPFPAGVPSAAAPAQATKGAVKTGPVDEEDLSSLKPNVAGGPAMNPRPNVSGNGAKAGA